MLKKKYDKSRKTLQNLQIWYYRKNNIHDQKQEALEKGNHIQPDFGLLNLLCLEFKYIKIKV